MKPRSNNDELLKFADSYLREAFPNPDRIGCPAGDALRTMATKPREADASVIEHVSYCSDCYCEYADLLLGQTLIKAASQPRSQQHRWSQVVWATIACALALAIGATIYWHGSASRPTAPATERHAAEAPTGGTSGLQASVVVDLSQASPTRGAKERAHRPLGPISVPASTVNIAIRLPLGMDEGTYTVALMTKNEAVWSAQAQARLESHQVILHIQADLSRVPSGQYQIDISSTAGTHIRQSVAVSVATLQPSRSTQ
jgi:hypothetical protein